MQQYSAGALPGRTMQSVEMFTGKKRNSAHFDTALTCGKRLS